MKNQKIYFASDFHLGTTGKLTSKEREKQIIRWLDMVSQDATSIYLVGDVFDFWFEYKTAVPRGYIRLLGKLREIRDRGIEIVLFTGNHDLWMFGYLEEELDILIHRQPIRIELSNKKFFIGHGDGLGPGDHGYKMLKKVLTNSFCQWLFARLHPNFALGIMSYFSKKSRDMEKEIPPFMGKDKEWLAIFSNETIESEAIDYFIFGHRHLTIDCTLNNGTSRYINTGEWLHTCSYAIFDGKNLSIQFFENEKGEIINV